MIEVGKYRLYKIDRSNWAIDTIGERKGEQVVVNRVYSGKLEHAASMLFSAVMDSPGENVEDLKELIKQVKEARRVIISEVKNLNARLSKVEAGLADVSTISDEIAIHNKEKNEDD
jgi:hypothetical protein